MAVFDFIKAKPNDSRKLEEVALDRIVPNPNQPRKSFDDESITELSQSIEQVGLIQPLIVRKLASGAYELVAGERRLRALRLLGVAKAPCVVYGNVETESSAMMALVENLQREDLHFFEEAQCYQELIDNYDLTQEELAQRLGKSQSSIANKLRVLRLAAPVKKAIIEAGVTERHARALLKLEDAELQLNMLRDITETGLSVKDTERRVEKLLDARYTQKIPGARPRPAMMRMVKDYRIFTNTINSAVSSLRDAGLTVDVQQTEREDGVDISISITRP
ncbi:MAG: ParB/RepB/Spo0J family partition protein [Clostridia bacterium]|nr:ParB/RepB/Spo0J family partition protein [Clostridia bacterium]